MEFITNPFINHKNNITFFDESKEQNIDIDQNNVHKYFTHVFILTKKNNEQIPIEFYNLEVRKDIFEQVSLNLIIQKINLNILTNKTHFDNCIILSDKQLEQYNIFNYSLKNKNIIIQIFNVEYQNLLKYLFYSHNY